MSTELNSNIALNDNTEKNSWCLNRVRVEEVTSDKDSILGMDYPSGILIMD